MTVTIYAVNFKNLPRPYLYELCETEQDKVIFQLWLFSHNQFLEFSFSCTKDVN